MHSVETPPPAARRGVLNDLSRPLRRYLFAQAAAGGLFVAAVLALPFLVDGTTTLVVVLLLGGLGTVGTVATSAGWVAWLRLADRRLLRQVSDGSRDLLARPEAGVRAPARVLRDRRTRASEAYLAGTSAPVPGRARVVVVEVLAPEGPRRAGLLAPAALGRWSRGRAVAVVLHPRDPEVALLDDRVGGADLAHVAADHRWSTARIPTDAAVAGGCLTLVAASALGLLTGLALGVAAVAATRALL